MKLKKVSYQMNNKKNKIVFSGVQPSGDLHIGNYLSNFLPYTY